MFNKKSYEDYDYYKSLMKKSEKIYEKYNLRKYIQNVTVYKEYVVKQQLYQFIVKICNNQIYGIDYVFSKEEIDFVLDYHIEKILYDIICEVSSDIKIVKSKNDFPTIHK